MKKLFFILLIVTLSSCTDKMTVKRLEDGAVLKAIDRQNRGFEEGDTVCITNPSISTNVYEISSHTWKDTIHSYIDTQRNYFFIYEMAVVIKN